MDKKWKKSRCLSCQADFAIHVEWSNPPKICKRCNLARFDLCEIIESTPSLTALDIDKSSKLNEILTQCKKSMGRRVLETCKEYALSFGFQLDETELVEGSNFFIIESLLRRKNGLSHGSDEGRTNISVAASGIQDILNPHGMRRRRLLNDEISSLILQNNDLYKAVIKAGKELKKLENADRHFIRKNESRATLVANRKRRLS